MVSYKGGGVSLALISRSPLRLVFTSDRVGVGVGVVSEVVRTLMTTWKSKIGVVSRVISATESESEESERFHFLPTPLTTPSLTFRLWSSENQIVGVGSRSGRINQSQCTFPRFVIGLVLLLLLPTPTIWFSLDHKHYASDYRPTPTPSLVKPAFRGLILIFRRVSPSLIFGSPLGNGCEEDQGIQDWFNLPVFVEYSQISKPTVKPNSHFVGVDIAILIFIKSVKNISSLLDLERGQHPNKLKLQEIRITLKTRLVTYSHITAPKKKIAHLSRSRAPTEFPPTLPAGYRQFKVARACKFILRRKAQWDCFRGRTLTHFPAHLY